MTARDWRMLKWYYAVALQSGWRIGCLGTDKTLLKLGLIEEIQPGIAHISLRGCWALRLPHPDTIVMPTDAREWSAPPDPLALPLQPTLF